MTHLRVSAGPADPRGVGLSPGCEPEPGLRLGGCRVDCRDLSKAGRWDVSEGRWKWADRVREAALQHSRESALWLEAIEARRAHRVPGPHSEAGGVAWRDPLGCWSGAGGLLMRSLKYQPELKKSC